MNKTSLASRVSFSSLERSSLGWILVYSPVLLCCLIMIPRLASPQFGLLDDGATLTIAQDILSGDWSLASEAGRGRFRPSYWLFNAGIYALAGKSPQTFFAGNLVIFAATTAGLIGLIQILGRNPFQAWVTGVLFALSSPAIETIYTLSKAEHLQLFWIILSLLLILPLRRGGSLARKIALFLAAALCLFMANTSKETSLVMTPLSFGWLLLGLTWRNSPEGQEMLRVRAGHFLAALLAAGVYFAVRAQFVPGGLTSGEYTGLYQIGAASILASALRWSGWLLRDFPYLVPLALARVVQAIGEKKAPTDSLYLDVLLWIGAWIVAFLPWHFTVEYYMLPLAMGCAVLAGLILRDVLASDRVITRGWKALVYVSLGLSGILWGMTLFNNYTNGRVQLAVDAANADMLAMLGEQTPTGGEVLVNLPHGNEYIDQIGLHLAVLHDRSDTKVGRFTPQKSPGNLVSRNPSLLITPVVDHKPLLSVRMGVYEEGADAWNRDLKNFLGPTAQPVYQTEQQFQLAAFDLPRLFCPLFRHRNYCSSPLPVFDRRIFTYGWEVYEVTNDTTGNSREG